MRSVTLGTLVTRCQQRADKENDSSIGTAEWKSLVSEMVGELHSLASEAGLRYFETTATITATGASSYTVPADHLATIRIVKVDANGRNPRPLVEVQVHDDEHPLSGQTGEARYYAIIGQTIEFYPNPASGSYRHRYVPQPADLGSSDDSTSVDLISPDGEALVVWGVAVKAKAKGEDDVQVAMMERDAARERVKTWLMARSFVTPRKMVTNSEDDYGGDPDGYRWSPP
jgi:hypothetical protein